MGFPATDIDKTPRQQSLTSIFGALRFSNQVGIAKLVVLAADALAFVIAAVGGTFVQWGYSSTADNLFKIWTGHTAVVTSLIYVALALVALSRFWQLGHYTRRRPFSDEVKEMLTVILALAVADAALMYISKMAFSRAWFISTWSLSFFLIPSTRILSKSFLLRLGKWQIPTIIVGTGDNAREAAEALHSERLMGLQVVAFGALHQADVPATKAIPVNGAPIPVAYLPNPVADIAAVGQPNVVLALGRGELGKSERLIERLHLEFSELSIVPALKGLPLYGMEINHFFKHEALFLRLRNNLARPGHRFIKRTFDIIASTMLLVILSPLFAYVAIRIKSSGGSVFFGHERIGCQGRPFQCYKFRSMVPNAQQILNSLLEKDPQALAEWQRDFKLKNDPRITPIGAFLRKTSLDELPQLWNVLVGDMSLVGPRPVISVELDRYGERVHYYLESRPGMTGLWQISGRNDTDYQNRVYLDTWYVKNWSLWQDIVILLRTVRVVLGRSGAY